MEIISVDPFRKCDEEEEERNGLVKGNKIEGRFAGLEAEAFSSFREGDEGSSMLKL